MCGGALNLPIRRSAKNVVTPEEWERNSELQFPGTHTARAATPSCPEMTTTVRVCVKTVTVPFEGVYSVGAEVLEVERPEASAKKAEKPRGIGRVWSKIYSRLRSKRKAEERE